ncbi:hypothetical protein CCHL11_05443 [Colletotrichum chlorophyti]|uniref:Uncharacterized protein n=1 Tax=Colletotrichum chlorophyti TaxID=708187 RepID=A0A1Q8RNF8_9PEZI|nr:hypothetical protein CCHL11_05443 [Colletotrichum chlorophyti]
MYHAAPSAPTFAGDRLGRSHPNHNHSGGNSGRTSPDKRASLMNSWRKPRKPQDPNAQRLCMLRKRKVSSSSIAEFNMTDPATHWRKPVSGVDPLLIATNPVFRESKFRVPEKPLESEVRSGATAKCAIAHIVPVIRNDKEAASGQSG